MFIAGKQEMLPLTLLAKLEKEGINVGLIIYKRQISWIQIKKYFKRKGLLKLIIHGIKKPFVSYREELMNSYLDTYLQKENLKLKPLKEYNLLLRSVSNLNYSFEALKEYGPDLIIHAGGGLINKSIIDIPILGVLNCHPSILPDYPGESGTRKAFEAGRAGVTVHYIDEGIDTGPIILKKEIQPEPTLIETKNKLIPETVALLAIVVCRVQTEFRKDNFNNQTILNNEKQL